MANAHFDARLSRFRCDNDGNTYISTEMKQLFEKKGIQIDFTIRHTPEQNGVAERMNRNILEEARCMLLSSKVDKQFWSEAVRTAVYMTNRSPTSAFNDNVPAFFWFREIPKYKKLKVFGCIAYLKILKPLVTGKF